LFVCFKNRSSKRKREPKPSDQPKQTPARPNPFLFSPLRPSSTRPSLPPHPFPSPQPASSAEPFSHRPFFPSKLACSASAFPRAWPSTHGPLTPAPQLSARARPARRSSPQTRCPFPHRQHGPTLSGPPSSFSACATNPEIPGPVISPAFLIGRARWDPGAPFKPPRSPSGNPTSPPHQTPNPGRLCSATHNPCAAVD